jgi:hypothetical protein
MFGELTLHLINWLANKSLEGGVCWERKSHLITTIVNESLQVQFLTSCSFSGQEAWRLLTICSPSGEELYRLTENAAAADVLPVRPIVDKLFLTAASLSQVN